jgi:glutamate/tyrosine decarboxylase-like PLP-dependent enzyme
VLQLCYCFCQPIHNVCCNHDCCCSSDLLTRTHSYYCTATAAAGSSEVDPAAAAVIILSYTNSSTTSSLYDACTLIAVHCVRCTVHLMNYYECRYVAIRVITHHGSAAAVLAVVAAASVQFKSRICSSTSCISSSSISRTAQQLLQCSI